MSEKSSLSIRLTCVAQHIAPTDLVIDVGSDHGQLSAYCLDHHVTPFVIATDIHKAPALRTESYLKAMGYEKQSKTFCTDGLSGIELKPRTTVVIAGMGGLEIRDILSDAMKERDLFAYDDLRFVLQPQRSLEELRFFLAENGFSIECESITKDRGRFYSVIEVTYSGTPYKIDLKEAFFGPYILKEKPPFYQEFMAHERSVIEKISRGRKEWVPYLASWDEWV